jgi:hypothetical protein
MPRQEYVTACLRVKTAQNSERGKTSNALLLLEPRGKGGGG